MASVVIVGGLSVFVSHRAVKDSEDQLLTVFSRRVMILCFWCGLTVVYWIAGRLSGFSGVNWVLPLYLNFGFLFGYGFLTVNSLGNLVKEYEVPESEKLEKMEESENLDDDYYIRYD